MSKLTDEQLKTIEEKRQKALEIKKNKHISLITHSNENVNKTNSTSFVSPCDSKSSSINLKCDVVEDNKFAVFCKYSPKLVAVFKSIPSRSYNPTKKTWTFCLSDFSTLERKLKNIGENITLPDNAVFVKTKTGARSVELNSFDEQKHGECYLISRTRFEVDVPFDADIVGLFKSISSKSYNITTRKWSFDLKDYNQLFVGLKKILSVNIAPLSSTVLSVFKNQISGKNPNEEQIISDSGLENKIAEFLKLLMPFQKEGVKFAISRRGRILLADDMGLGKTVQSICIAFYYMDEWPLLVICPSSVRLMWKEALLKWLPTRLAEEDIHLISSGRDAVSNASVSIISYDLLTKVQKDIMKKEFKIIIVDESHFIKNFKTARTRAVTEVGKSSKRLVLLSGTPALSRPVELFTQLSLLRPDVFSNFRLFGSRYCGAKQSPWGWEYSGSSNMEELRLILEETVMLRRTKDDVLTQLPPKLRRAVTVDVEISQKNSKLKESFQRTFEFMERKGVTGVEKHGALLQLFHETALIKLPAVKAYVLDLLEGGHKFLVFAHHKIVLDSLQEDLDKKKFGYMRIDGSTSSEKRQSEVTKFQENFNCKVALLSITAANMGINLHAASLVVFAELFWNPGILVQAEDRCYRIGQCDVVNVHYLVARGTSDDYIWEMVKKKLNVLSQAGLNKSDFDNTESQVLKKESQNSILRYFQTEGSSKSPVENEDVKNFDLSITDEELQLLFENERLISDEVSVPNSDVCEETFSDEAQSSACSESNRNKRNKMSRDHVKEKRKKE